MSSDRGLSDEERRLRAYLEAGGRIHPGRDDDEAELLEWPEHLALNHPELFPRRRKPEPRIGSGTRRLMWTAVPLVLLLVWAEITDSLVGDAWLLAVIAAVAALAFWVGFLAKPWLPYEDPASIVVLGFEIYYRSAGQVGFVVLVGVFGVAAYFGLRAHRTIDEELSALIPPVPEIVDVTYVPTGTEVLALEAMIAGFDGGGAEAIGNGDRPLDEAVAEAHARPTYWLVETRLDTSRVAAFYDAAAPGHGWDVANRGKGLRVLRRGAERLIIFTTDDWPRPNTKVLYMHSVSLAP